MLLTKAIRDDGLLFISLLLMKYEALGFVFLFYSVVPLLDNMSHLHVLDLNWLNEFAFCFFWKHSRAVWDLPAVTLDFGYTV